MFEQLHLDESLKFEKNTGGDGGRGQRTECVVTAQCLPSTAFQCIEWETPWSLAQKLSNIPQIVLHTPPQCTNCKAVADLSVLCNTEHDTDKVKAIYSSREILGSFSLPAECQFEVLKLCKLRSQSWRRCTTDFRVLEAAIWRNNGAVCLTSKVSRYTR